MFLYEVFAEELAKIENRLEDIKYQIEFFGMTPELNEEKREIELMLEWLRTQYNEIQETFQTLKQKKSHTITP